MTKRKGDSPRLPFDPNRIRGEEVPPASDSTISVSQLSNLIKSAIARAFPSDVRVMGELSNISRPAGGHIYFTLKDATSEVRCVMWRSSVQSLKFDLAEGMEVVATGTVDVYEPRGQYQLYVRRMSPVGVGALELAFQQLKEKLSREGFFDSDRKRPLPAHPQTIAVVTSPTGAAVKDILQTIERRYPRVRVLLFGVKVQGDGAAGEIAEAIRRINHSCESLGGVDVMIVGRGGGSLEDLWAFNEEVVARAIHASEIPIVSAVGHEVDFTMADFVADVRAATPSAAAELVVPMLTDVLGEIGTIEHRLRQAIRRRIEAGRLRLTSVERSPWFRDPLGQVRRVYQRIDEVLGRLRLSASRRIHRARSRIHDIEVRYSHARPVVQLSRRRERIANMERRLERAMENDLRRRAVRVRRTELALSTASPKRIVGISRARLESIECNMRRAMHRLIADDRSRTQAVEARLQAASHEQILNRGFSITRRSSDDKVVRTADQVLKGDKITTQTAEGFIESRVMDGKQGELFD